MAHASVIAPDSVLPPALEAPRSIEPTVAPLMEDPDLRTPREIILDYALEYGVNPRLAYAIAKCESGLNRLAKNPSSTAESYYQFLNSTWERTMERMGLPVTTSKFDPIISIKAGVFLLKEDGTIHWISSQDCWSKLL